MSIKLKQRLVVALMIIRLLVVIIVVTTTLILETTNTASLDYTPSSQHIDQGAREMTSVTGQ